MRTDIVKTYKAVHTWVGITSALFLFIAFYAGAITMFELPLQRWASAPSTALPPAVALDEAPELARQAVEAHPEARKAYAINFAPSPANPARVTWTIRDPADHHSAPHVYGAAFDDAGALVVQETGGSPVAQFIDVLHQQVGLPFDHDISMPVTGVVSLLYFLALVSGVVVLVPTLVKNLFLIRARARAVRRKWLDMHNTLGIFSLPFHVMIALTAVVFASHHQFYDVQDAVLYQGRQAELARPAPPALSQPAEGQAMLLPSQMAARLAEQAPTFQIQQIEYRSTPAGTVARILGHDNRYMLRGPTFGIGVADPYTGELVQTDYFPDRQPSRLAIITTFFGLHFGNFGGTPIRWAYVALGLSGAFLFYTGNVLWVEARRKRLTAANPALAQPRSVRFLSGLTAGVCLGTMAGISLTIAAAKWLPATLHLDDWHAGIFYAVLALALGWAFWRGSARATDELLWLCAACTFAIPFSSLLGLAGVAPWSPNPGTWAVDAMAFAGGAGFAAMAWKARASFQSAAATPAG
ncbi:MAG: PepSY-associated TM helix domain-containing protein [Verrucomicrobiota bacterium JB022]|nr:PepSY-associated TM helix domain-containing protein [Verrucomicrobiota bacterium JB022]